MDGVGQTRAGDKDWARFPYTWGCVAGDRGAPCDIWQSTRWIAERDSWERTRRNGGCQCLKKRPDPTSNIRRVSLTFRVLWWRVRWRRRVPCRIGQSAVIHILSELFGVLTHVCPLSEVLQNQGDLEGDPRTMTSTVMCNSVFVGIRNR